MQSEDWHRVEELLNAALELEPAARRKFLDTLEAPTLRREVESLLVCETEMDGFLSAPALALSADFFDDDNDDGERAGQAIGRYRIIKEIGRGGMGAVYLAERADDEYQQQVAIKVIKRGYDTDEVRRRFRNERQILARLEHPNIARLLDGGTTEDGLAYFVMEYVEGQPLNEYADTHKLSTVERLKLFRIICAAVTHAHQNLVVHRDLKPSNILVTSEGTPKLLDFGIAKLLHGDTHSEADTMTATNLRVLTPEYASPEQVRGLPVTTATDVYSLGVLLYELLTGHRPYRLKNRHPQEIERVICEEQPDRPSTAINRIEESANTGSEMRGTSVTPQTVSDARDTQPDKLRRRLAGDLDNIVLMAMRKEPARRYASVGQFSEDIRWHLEGLPVLARKDTFNYRASKFVRRNKIGVAAAAVILLLLVGGIVATAWQARRATAQARIAASERDRAERRFNDVRKLSNSLLFEIAPKIERLEGSIEAREKLVERALEYLDSLAREAGDDMQLQSELASAYEKVGALQGAMGRPNLSDFKGALASLEKAGDMRRELLKNNPNEEGNRERLAADLNMSSEIRRWTSDVSGSIKDSEQSLELYSKLVVEQPASVALHIADADARINLALTYYFNDQVSEVYPPLRTALTELEALRETNADNSEIGRLLSKGYVLLGLNLFWDNKAKEGESQIIKAVQLSESLIAKNPQDNVLKQGLWYVYGQSAQFYEDDNPAQAIQYVLKALKLAEESVKLDSANVQARQNLAKTYSLLGADYSRTKKLDDAALYLEKSLAVFAELERAEPRNLTYKDDIGRIYKYLGLVKYQQRDYAGALAAYEKAVEVFEYQSTDPKNFFPQKQLATVYNYIGQVHTDWAKAANVEGRGLHLQQAKENYQRALNILRQMEAQNALTEYERKFLEEVSAAAKQ